MGQPVRQPTERELATPDRKPLLSRQSQGTLHSLPPGGTPIGHDELHPNPNQINDEIQHHQSPPPDAASLTSCAMYCWSGFICPLGSIIK